MKKLRFLVSLHGADNDFQVAQAKCAEDTARKLGIDVEVVFAEDDAVNQSTQLLKAIQGPKEFRPDGILMEPVGATALPIVAQVASSAGIGWVILNRRPDYLGDLRVRATAPIFAVVSDHLEIGRIQGKQFSTLLPEGGTVLYIEGPTRSSSAQKRTTGMLETKMGNIQISTLRANWTVDSAVQAVSSWLRLSTSKSTPINLVGAQDDAMAMGARKAFEQLPDPQDRIRWTNLPFTGCDGQPATGQIWVKKKLLAATIYIPPLTGVAIETLATALNNGTQPPEHSVTKPISFPELKTLSPWKS